MIEVIYKDEKKEAKENEAFFSVPRNVRQIGTVNDNCRIYVEDYVYTYLSRMSGGDKEQGNSHGNGNVAVLTGETKWAGGSTYLFVRGAVKVEDMEADTDHIDFSGEIWERIYEEKDQYFPDQEIVGWFFSKAQLTIEATEVFTRAHLKHFGGEKVLMLMDPAEREDAFFCYENGYLLKQSGYYIYYEKNPLMQTYMIEKNQTVNVQPSEAVDDEAVKNFRKIIKGKKKEEEPEEEQVHPSVFSYAATACLVIAVLTVGVNFYQNYQGMGQKDAQTREVSAVLETEKGAAVSPAPKLTEPAASLTPASQRTEGADRKRISGSTPSLDQEKESMHMQESQMSGNVASEDAASEGMMTGNAATRDLSVQEMTSQNTPSHNTVSDTSNESFLEEADVRKARTSQGVSGKKENSRPTSGNSVRPSYVIRPGDTLFQISMDRYGNIDAMKEICRLNNLSEDEIIYPGQIIVLP